MTEIFNKQSSSEKRKALRQNCTMYEHLLWQKLKSKQILNLIFRRQYGIGSYIVDFYCPSIRLAIEVDGEYHDEEGQRQSDVDRQLNIENLGIKMLRFTNQQILDTMPSVIEEIQTVSLLRRGS